MKTKCLAFWVVAIIALTGIMGCVKNGDGTSSQGDGAYSIVNYDRIIVYPNGIGYLEPTIKGPANDLGVVLIPPKGEPIIVTIDRKEMLANSKSVSLMILQESREQKGEWTLLVKTINPEKIVWKGKIIFSGPVQSTDMAQVSK